MLKTSLMVLALGAVGCGGGNGGASLCTGIPQPCIGLPAGSSENTVQQAFVTIGTQGTIVFDKGTFKFNNALTLATPNVTVKGQGMDTTILDFGGQQGGDQGIYDNANGFTLEDLTVQDTFGDAVKVEGATGVTFQRVHVLWTSSDMPNHGAYGLYPVQCTNVLMQDCKVEGASDSGIYVGQSNEIVVRRNTVSTNVAGLEIENSHDADVYSNTAVNNTAGIMVFALPNLQMQTTKNVRVYMNTIMNNNTPTFASNGDIVSKVPAGTGFMVMASDSVEIFQNTISGNETAQSGIISYYVADSMFPYMPGDAYYVFPTNIWFHDNTYTGGGNAPDQSNLIGIALAHTTFPNSTVSSILYDGILDSQRAGMGVNANNTMSICLSNNTGATFANLKADMMAAGSVSFDMISFDETPYDCMLTPLPAVSFPGSS